MPLLFLPVSSCTNFETPARNAAAWLIALAIAGAVFVALLVRIPHITREAVEARELTRFDRSHFKEFGAISLNFEIIHYIATPDYNQYMDIQQAINFHIHEAFEREGIQFAYPTQSLFIEQLSPDNP